MAFALARTLRSLAATPVALLLAWAAQAQTQTLQVSAHVQPEQSVHSTNTVQAAYPAIVTDIDLGGWIHSKQTLFEGTGGAHPIGAPRTSPSTSTAEQLHQALDWRATERGGWVGALRIRSAGAYGVRLGLLIDQLPGSAIVRLYHAPGDGIFEIPGHRILQLLQANQEAGDHGEEGRTWWAPESEQESVTLEIELPEGITPQQLRIGLPRIVHIYENIWMPKEKPGSSFSRLNESDSCNIDVQCTDALESERNAVVRMSYIDKGVGYLCSGTLVNNLAQSQTPYFLTANHCIGNQTTASTLQTYWFYQSTACNSRSLSRATQTLRAGARLLYTRSHPDFTLLQLNEPPPAGAVFAGWDSQPAAVGQPIIGLHHPSGDMQKISHGRVSDYKQCTPFDANGVTSCTTNAAGDYYEVQWQRGITESGSSGSGLFANKLLVGTLSSGQSTCRSTSGTDNYTRFDRMFPQIAAWLAPEPVPQGPALSVRKQAVYRFFNTDNGTHFYTASSAERDQILTHSPQYRYEHIAFYVSPESAKGLVPAFRFFNRDTGSHFYTASPQERDHVRQHYRQFTFEGNSWYASAQDASDMAPVFRFFHPKTGTHFYTVATSERDDILQFSPEYSYEGVSYYVWLTP